MRHYSFVSDLHLGRPSADDQRVGVAFTGFLDSLGRDPTGTEHVVLLGDCIELLAAGGSTVAIDRLQWIVGQHPAVFAALGAASHRGVDIHVVPGNHDLALHRDDVWAAWLAAVDGAASRLHRDPIGLVAPAVFAAEHGHLRHGINTPWRDPAAGATVELPPGGWLEVRAPYRAMVPGLARWAWRRATRPGPAGPQATLERVATEELRRIRHPVRRSLLTAARRRAAGGPDPYLPRAAAAIAAVLERHGAAVAYHVFGHDHRAGTEVLNTPGGPATYLNCGTWTDEVAAGARRANTVVRITIDGERHAADLYEWDPHEARLHPWGPPVAVDDLG